MTPLKIATVDLESNGLLDTVSVIHQLSIKPLGEPVESYNEQPGNKGLDYGISRMDDFDKIVMHNGLNYDLMAMEIVWGCHPAWEKIIDTLVLSKLGRPERKGHRPHSLESWGYRLGGLPGKVENEDWSKWTPAIEERCNKDTVIGEAVYLKLAPMYDIMPAACATEHAVAWAIAKMQRKGFRLDVPYAIELAKELRGQLEEINRELQPVFPPILVSAHPSAPERVLKVINRNHPLKGLLEPGSPYCPLVTQEFNPGSTQQVSYRLKAKYDWQPLAFTPGGAPEVSETTLSGLEYPEAAVFLKYLKAQKLLSFVDGKPKRNWEGGGWLHHERLGRVHCSLNPTGTITHRPSCSKPNLQQVPKQAKLRRAFLPSEGRVLVGMDADGIEMRMLGHYLSRHDGGDFAKEVVEGDVHTKIMQLVGWDLSDDPKIIKDVCRDNTKSMEYAIIYGAGNPKLGEMAWENARDCGSPSPDYATVGAKPMRNGNPPSLARLGACTRGAIEAGIQGWEDLNEGVKQRAKAYGRLRGIDGRTLWVRSAHSALNLLLQSAGVIVVKRVIELAPDALKGVGLKEGIDYDFVLWVHDELQYEANPGCAELVGKTLANLMPIAGKQLGVRCELSGSWAVGNNWSETH
jgi:DNA polymerase-1